MKIVYIVIQIVLLSMVPLESIADTLILNSGAKIVTGQAWEEGEEVKFYLGNEISSLPKDNVKRIEKSSNVPMGGRDQNSQPSVSQNKPISVRSDSTKLDQNTLIPKDLTITVKDEFTKGNVKRQLEVILNKKVSAGVLEAIAHDLKGRDPHTYERTFISYRIAGTDSDSGYWATTHFNPNLEVKIIGIDAENERSLLKDIPSQSDREIIGVWFEDRIPVENKIVIYKRDQSLYIERTYSDGSSGTKKLTEEPVTNGTKLFDRPGNEFGEYYLLTKDGNLQYWNRTRNYYTPKKIQ